MAAQETIDSPITIGFKQFVDYAFNLWVDALKTGKSLKTLCLLGPPGIGKSSTAYTLARKMTAYARKNPDVIVAAAKRIGVEVPADAVKLLTEGEAACRLLDFSSMLPEDLNGLPFRDGNFTRYCPQEWVAELTGALSYGVVVQDDLPAAAPAMHTAGRQMALERRIHSHKFAPGVLIIVTGNRREDKAAAKTLPSHFRNSVCLLGIEPDVDEWRRWYDGQEGLSMIVSAFIKWQPGMLSQLPKDEDKMGAFPTPRQWVSLGSQFDAAMATCEGQSSHMLLAVAAGLIGKGNASTFCGFVEVFSKLPDPEKVLDNPEREMPNPEAVLGSPDKQIAMTVALGDAAAKRWKNGEGKLRDEAPMKLMLAIAHVCGTAGEYTATGIQTFLDAGGNLTSIARIAQQHRSHKVLGPMFDHIKDALLGGA